MKSSFLILEFKVFLLQEKDSGLQTNNTCIRGIVTSDVSCLIPLNSSGTGTTLMSFLEKVDFLKAISEHLFVCPICIKTSVQGSETSGPVVTGFQVSGLLTGYSLYNLLPC